MAGSTRRLREDVAALTKTIAALRAEVAELRAAQGQHHCHGCCHPIYVPVAPAVTYPVTYPDYVVTCGPVSHFQASAGCATVNATLTLPAGI